MTERPILFSGAMVRAILNGRKTQTRRIAKPRPSDNLDAPGGSLYALPSPYGSPGDRLWVRETWCLAHPEYDEIIRAGTPRGPHGEACYYAATDNDVEGDNEKSPWRPSIHMPRWASRITLEILSMRVQRLQDISEHDAREEGVEELDGEIDAAEICRMAKAIGDMAENNRTWFACLWNSINGKRAPWSSNPWVWAIEFTMTDGGDK